MSYGILIDTKNLDDLMKGLQELPDMLKQQVLSRAIRFATDKSFTLAIRNVISNCAYFGVMLSFAHACDND